MLHALTDLSQNIRLFDLVSHIISYEIFSFSVTLLFIHCSSYSAHGPALPRVHPVHARRPRPIHPHRRSFSGKKKTKKKQKQSLPIYQLNVFQAQKWLIKKIDRIRRSFLWRGETPDRTNGGHSLINWPTTCSPKNKGGLGILDMDRFTRALRLRWMWFQ
jgi:hypothetical protein